MPKAPRSPPCQPHNGDRGGGIAEMGWIATDNWGYRSAWDLRAVAGSAKLYLKTGQFRKLVFGKEKDFDAPLSSLGPLLGRVACIDPAIPKEK